MASSLKCFNPLTGMKKCLDPKKPFCDVITGKCFAAVGKNNNTPWGFDKYVKDNLDKGEIIIDRQNYIFGPKYNVNLHTNAIRQCEEGLIEIDYEKQDLECLTKKNLRDLADRRSIRLSSTSNKDDIITAILSHQELNKFKNTRPKKIPESTSESTCIPIYTDQPVIEVPRIPIVKETTCVSVYDDPHVQICDPSFSETICVPVCEPSFSEMSCGPVCEPSFTETTNVPTGSGTICIPIYTENPQQKEDVEKLTEEFDKTIIDEHLMSDFIQNEPLEFVPLELKKERDRILKIFKNQLKNYK